MHSIQSGELVRITLSMTKLMGRSVRGEGASVIGIRYGQEFHGTCRWDFIDSGSMRFKEIILKTIRKGWKWK